MLLKDIQDTAACYARIIAGIIGIDVEVVDAELTRLAGTGRYAADVGRTIAEKKEGYRQVLRTGRSLILETPPDHPVCRLCVERECCRAVLSCTAPLKDDGEVSGIIGLICLSEKERTRFLNNRETYVPFLELCGETMLPKLREHAGSDPTQMFLHFMLRILDVSNRGIVLFNAKGDLAYLNETARQILGIGGKELPLEGVFRRTGEKFSDLEEYVFVHKGHVCTLAGRMVTLTPPYAPFAAVFTFEPFPRMAEHISAFGPSFPECAGIESIPGHSSAMISLKEQILSIARSASTVLVTGESGTGKEMVARVIHAVGERGDRPFVSVHCGAVPDVLLESELFGYTGEAFPSANAKGRIGKCELAQGGVLFLDEITTIPLYLQIKLVHFLQEQMFSRLGSDRRIKADIRVIAATSENVPQAIQEGRFREDLFHCLQVVHLHIPPLRERREDIQVLADHFLAKYGKLLKKRIVAADAAFLEALSLYSWPGNIREFENVIEFVVNTMDTEDTLHAGLLPTFFQERVGVSSEQARASLRAFRHQGIVPLADLERQAIQNALRHFGDDTPGKKAAAAALGIGIATLYRKLKEYGTRECSSSV